MVPTRERSKRVGFGRGYQLSFLVVALAGFAAAADDAAPPKLRYELKLGDVFAYEVSIVSDQSDSTDELKGIVTYTVKAATDQQLDVTFAGDLQRKETPKGAPAPASSGPRRPGGPRPGGGPSGPRGPLFGNANTTMTGLTWQTNELRLTKSGEFISLKGTSHLPYVLGNLSLLPFERFADDAKKAWGVDSGATISESGNSSRVPGPRFLNNEEKDKKQTAGGESVRYEIERQEGRKVTVRRTSDLKTAPQEGKGLNLNLQLAGTCDVDADRGLTTASESKGKLIVRRDNLTLEIPLVIKLKLLSEEERQQLEKDKKDQIAQAKQQQEDAAAKLKQPLTDEERQEIIKKLEGTNIAFIGQTLQMLAKREPAAEDKAIAVAIKPHLTSNFPVIRGWAEGTWKTWSKLVEDKDSAKSDTEKTKTQPTTPNRPARPARPARPSK